MMTALPKGTVQGELCVSEWWGSAGDQGISQGVFPAAAGGRGTLLRMKARGQATGASTTMHTLMIHTVLAPNLQIGTELSWTHSVL